MKLCYWPKDNFICSGKTGGCCMTSLVQWAAFPLVVGRVVSKLLNQQLAMPLVVRCKVISAAHRWRTLTEYTARTTTGPQSSLTFISTATIKPSKAQRTTWMHAFLKQINKSLWYVSEQVLQACCLFILTALFSCYFLFLSLLLWLCNCMLTCGHTHSRHLKGRFR